VPATVIDGCSMAEAIIARTDLGGQLTGSYGISGNFVGSAQWPETTITAQITRLAVAR
jgi:hypothetical protein